LSSVSHKFQCRVYYEDTDHGGVVYYANYLKFMERGRTEYLRSSGIELDNVESEEGVMFAVTEANVRYRVPARFNELLEVDTALTHARGARLAFRQQVWRISEDGVTRDTLLTEAEIKLACIDRDGGARRIPASLLPVLKTHQTEDPSNEPS